MNRETLSFVSNQFKNYLTSFSGLAIRFAALYFTFKVNRGFELPSFLIASLFPEIYNLQSKL